MTILYEVLDEITYEDNWGIIISQIILDSFEYRRVE